VSTQSVLVVDDERFFREGISRALAGAGIACVAAADAAEALQRVAEPGVAVLVLDLQLGESPGLELLVQLRSDHPLLRVIALSTASEQELVLEALRQGACDYLVKPLHEEELVLAVRRALAGHEALAGLEQLHERLTELQDALASLAQEAAASGEASPAERRARIARGAAQLAAGLSGARRSSLMLPDASGLQLEVAAQSGVNLDAEAMDPVALGKPVAGLAAEIGEPVYANDVAADVRFAGHESVGRYATGAFAILPLATEGPTGVLCVADPGEGELFGRADLALLRILALHTGALLASVAPVPAQAEAGPQAAPRAADEPRGGDGSERADSDAELAALICDAVTAEIEPARVLDAALRPVARLLKASPVSLYLLDSARGRLALECQVAGGGAGDHESLPRDRGLTASVLQSGRLVASDHPEADPRFDPAVDRPLGSSTGPFLCVPLRLRGKVLGVARVFPEGDLPAPVRSAELIAAALSAAVRNVLLYRSLLESIDEVARARQEHGAEPTSGRTGPAGNGFGAGR